MLIELIMAEKFNASKHVNIVTKLYKANSSTIQHKHQSFVTFVSDA